MRHPRRSCELSAQDSYSLNDRDIAVFKPAGPLVKPPLHTTWTGLMHTAIAQAVAGAQRDEIPVGALIVHASGKILSMAANGMENLGDPTAHAEILAIRQAAAACQNMRLLDCVLVTTLEPCAMCACACVHARLAGVVFGAHDPASGAVVSNADLLDRSLFGHTIWHMGSILAEQCAALLKDFFARKRSRMAYK